MAQRGVGVPETDKIVIKYREIFPGPLVGPLQPPRGQISKFGNFMWMGARPIGLLVGIGGGAGRAQTAWENAKY